MKTIKFRSNGQEVLTLQQKLVKLGYKITVSDYFGEETETAVKDFQRKNNLVADGIVGSKTWAKFESKENNTGDFNEKLLSEQDLNDFAKQYDVELAAVKAVNEIESRGSGFLNDGRPKILFEGHIFWRQLVKLNLSPESALNEENKDVLYKKWTRNFYLGGAGEYGRLEKAVSISLEPGFKEAAYASASWGAFQIMGYHYKSLGYASVDDFVTKMYEHEREHLGAFGRYLEKNNLIRHLKSKNWASFARGYNGPSFAANKYDEKLKKAYERFQNL
ncbi:N-acetylmuramidase domain-containing protein [Maribellus maritimus]|uniref:N-acetylmuramidase domain-containing protein n=1 Tax=Maribellus maritimus TaxID=2870838 RepID=UPI001EEA04B7|nr:N-acetylmuramidase family protein [Maribellus maritimus]MCG6187824.1 N-acetylmuramidase family protein [Maribellus maritimus]